MDKTMPLKRLKFKKYKHKKQPWITNGFLKSIKYKDRSLKLTPCNTPEFIDKKANLHVFKSILTRCIPSAKKSYFHTQLKIYQSDVNQTWNILNKLKNRSDSSLPSDVNINGHSVTDI